MFYPIHDVSFEGSTVILPSISIGNVPQLAIDLLVSTLEPVLVGYIHHEELLPVVGSNAYDEKSNQISSSCEVYYLADSKLIFLQLRGAVVMGCEKTFCKDLIDWMISSKAKRLVILMSVTAEIRKDKDLQGCQIRYTLPSTLKDELENKLKACGWSEYEDPEAASSEDLSPRISDAQLYVPSGGFGQQLYEMGNHRGLPSLGVLMYAYEGDNECEALAMADALTSYHGLKVGDWKKPESWRLLYGSGPPPEIY